LLTALKNDKMKVYFIDTVHQALEEELSKNGFECIDVTKDELSSLKVKLENADGIVIRSRFPMNELLLQFAPRLKFIARSGAGMENIDVPYCEKRNITLFNAPEGNRNAVAEHALGMLLSLMNKFQKGDKEVRQGMWDREGNRGEELDGKTIGIIGYGNNGRAFAKKLRGFDTEVLVYDKYLTNIDDNYVKQVNLETLYQKSDVISFHIPQNEETLFWVDDLFFEKISKPFYLLNLSRGKIVSIKALLNAIEVGKVKGAGLDVLEFEKASFESFDQEKAEDFKALVSNQKVLLTPHVGGWTKESYLKLSTVLGEKILNWYKKLENK
jgi:D-3-phosphoglycerate dehydrogenase